MGHYCQIYGDGVLAVFCTHCHSAPHSFPSNHKPLLTCGELILEAMRLAKTVSILLVLLWGVLDEQGCSGYTVMVFLRVDTDISLQPMKHSRLLS